MDDGRYIAPVLWTLDEQRIKIEDLPERAFDSPAEKATVAALLEQYNHPPDSEYTLQTTDKVGSADNSNPQSSATPDTGSAQDEESDNASPDEESTKVMRVMRLIQRIKTQLTNRM